MGEAGVGTCLSQRRLQHRVVLVQQLHQVLGKVLGELRVAGGHLQKPAPARRPAQAPTSVQPLLRRRPGGRESALPGQGFASTTIVLAFEKLLFPGCLLPEQ